MLVNVLISTPSFSVTDKHSLAKKFNTSATCSSFENELNKDNKNFKTKKLLANFFYECANDTEMDSQGDLRSSIRSTSPKTD